MMPEHQNVTTRSCGCVLVFGMSILVFGTREGEGNTRTCPCGHVLVFRLWEFELGGWGRGWVS